MPLTTSGTPLLSAIAFVAACSQEPHPAQPPVRPVEIAGTGTATEGGCVDRIAHARVRAEGDHFSLPDGNRFYMVGANLPWLDGHYGNYLAASAEHPTWGAHYDHDRMKLRLGQIRSLDLNVARLFLFTDLQGLVVDRDGKMNGLSDEFVRNLDDTIEIGRSLGIKLYLTLLEGVANHRADELLPERMLFSNADALDGFERNVIGPLAERYKGEDSVFAFDILNESNHELEGALTWPQLARLISTTAQEIHGRDGARLVTASLVRANDKNMNNLRAHYAEMNLDFYDVHLYGDDPQLPDARAYQLDKPIIMGEFGQNEGGDANEQDVAAARFLVQARSRGWSGSLIWALDFPESPKEYKLFNGDGSWRPVATTLQRFAETVQHDTCR